MTDLPEFPFEFEFYNETDQPDDELYKIAYEKITEVAEGHNDIVGASISLKELTGDETPHAYESNVVLYVRPDNISATQVEESALDSLQNALEAAIKQVRDKREQLRNY